MLIFFFLTFFLLLLLSRFYFCDGWDIFESLFNVYNIVELINRDNDEEWDDDMNAEINKQSKQPVSSKEESAF